MIIDIAIITIILLYGIAGGFRGFAFTFIHTMGWLMAIVLSFMATPYVEKFLLKRSDISSKFSVEGFKGLDLPAIFKVDLSSLTNNFLFTIVVFIFLIISIRLILAVFLSLYTRSIKGGAVGGLDVFFGFLLGLLKGAIIILLLLFIVYPISNYFYPDMLTIVTEQLKTSYISNIIYSYNPIWMVVSLFAK